MLPVASALAVLLGIFALVAGPAGSAATKPALRSPRINSGLLGLLTLLIVPVQMLLVAFAMRGFQQGWNVELERREPDAACGGLRRRAATPRLSGRVSSPASTILRRWRNGRRGALKRPCPKGRVGSIPTRRIQLARGAQLASTQREQSIG